MALRVLVEGSKTTQTGASRAFHTMRSVLRSSATRQRTMDPQTLANPEILTRHHSPKDLRTQAGIFSLLFRIGKAHPVVRSAALSAAAIALETPGVNRLLAPASRLFYGGNTQAEIMQTAKTVEERGYGVILAPAIEDCHSEEDSDKNLLRIYDNIDYATQTERQCVSIKLSSLATLDTLRNSESNSFKDIKFKLSQILKRARQKGVEVQIDAEYDDIQTNIQNLCLNFMKDFNKDKVILRLCVQMYKTESQELIHKWHQTARDEGYILALRQVNGCHDTYLGEKHTDQESTHTAYVSMAKTLIKRPRNIDVTFATHNEIISTRLVQMLIDAKNKRPSVFLPFRMAQLYGMGDSLDFARFGVKADKYVPNGPGGEKYLLRRFGENTSTPKQCLVEIVRRQSALEG